MMSRFSPFYLLLALVLAPTIARAQENSTALFRSLGLLGPNASLTRVTVRKPPENSAQNRLAAGQQNLTGPLKFDFSGYPSAQRAVLQAFVRDNYANMVAVYGAPAPEQAGKTVKVRFETKSADYEPPAATNNTGGTIFFGYDSASNQAVNTYNFTRVALIAFQGPRVPAFDFAKASYVEPWLYGAADAGAFLVAYRAQGAPANFNPSALGGYLLPLYDYFNRPGLGNAYIYPRNGAALAISAFRLTMAQAAFLKLTVENPNFLAQFNAKLYARGTARASIAPNELESLAAGVAPNVEGRSFNDWVRAQYALDASVTTGQKLYLAAYPFPTATSGANSSNFAVFAQAYQTDAQGAETASSGYGSVAAFDETGRDISAQSTQLSANNVLNFGGNAEFPGESNFQANFTGATAPARALITIKARYNQAEATAYTPVGVAGDSAANSSYFGGTIGGQNGLLQLSGSATQNVNVTRGTWAATARYPSGPRVQTAFAFGGATVRRNTAWLAPGATARSVAFLLEVPANLQTLNFSTPGGKSSVRMVSLPGFPLQTDEAKALDIAPGDLKLARYRPNLSPATTTTGGALRFGIGGDRYELYPNISAPIAPGRGYWLGVGQGGYATAVQASLPPADRAYEVPLQGGWNQIGVPFNQSFAADAITVRNGGFAPVSLQEARRRGWVAPGIWRWLPAGGYVRADVGDATLLPFEGYFIFAGPNSGVSLIFDASASSAAKTSLERVAAGSWSVSLHAIGQDSSDIAGVFGVSSAPNVAKPPAGARVVSLRFEGSAPGAAQGSGLAESYVAALDESASWTVVVDGTQPGENVTLKWGKFTADARKVALTLRDAETGARVAMRSGGSYQFVAGQTPRRLTISAVEAPPEGASNRAPIAYDGTVNSARGERISKGLRASDPDGDALTFRLVRPAKFGRSRVALDPADGQWKLRVTGTRQTPGNVDKAQFVAVDEFGQQSNVATITIRYLNRAPVASDLSARVAAGARVVVPVAGSDADGDALTFALVGTTRHGISRLRRDADGAWKLFYLGRAGWTGVEKVRYVAIDRQGRASAPATITIAVTASAASASPASAGAASAPDASGGAS